MDIKDFNKVNVLMGQRAALLADIAVATETEGNGLGVTINGRYQDTQMRAAVRSAVVEELKRRLRIIEADLKSFGVTI